MLLGRPPAEPAAGQSLRSAVLAGRPAAAALVGGFLAAGLVVAYYRPPTAGRGNSRETPDTADAAFFSERRLRVLYLGLALAAVAALGIDQATARYSAAGHGPPLLGQVLECCAMFGHASGSFLVLAVVCRFDPPPPRPALDRGLRAAGGPDGQRRQAARRADASPGRRSAERSARLSADGCRGGRIGQSFPSGDAATAIALALALAALSGRRPLVFVVAGLVAWQRVACGRLPQRRVGRRRRELPGGGLLSARRDGFARMPCRGGNDRGATAEFLASCGTGSVSPDYSVQS